MIWVVLFDVCYVVLLNLCYYGEDVQKFPYDGVS